MDLKTYKRETKGMNWAFYAMDYGGGQIFVVFKNNFKEMNYTVFLFPD